MKKKILIMMVVFITCFGLFTFKSNNAEAAVKKHGSYKVMSYVKNDYDSVSVHLGSKVNKIVVNLKQWGIHSGEKADITWSISYFNGGERKTWRVQGDGTNTLTYYVKHPGGSYHVSWMSNNKNDMQGWYYVTVDGQVQT